MKTKRLIKKYCAAARALARSDAPGSGLTGEHLTTLLSAGASLRGDAEFLRFADSDAFGAFVSRLAGIAEGGVLPSGDSLSEKLADPGLSAGETVFLRQSITFLLIRAAGEAAVSGDEEGLKNAFLSFFTLRSTDFSALRERCCRADRIFRGESAGQYGLLDDETKDLYIRALYRLSRKNGRDADALARGISSRANEKGVHVGALLPLRRDHGPLGKALILVGIALSVLSAAALGIFTRSVPAALLCLLPLSEVFTSLMRTVGVARISPAPALRMDPAKLPAGRRRAAIVVSAMLSVDTDIQSVEKRLLSLYLSQRECDTHIVLLCDLPPSKKARDDKDAESVEKYRSMINRLNEVSPRFVLALRGRKYSRSERCFIGRERKRGAILALTQYITTGKNEFAVLHGAAEKLRDCPYMLLLDEDTQIPFGSLIGALAAAEHPLNRPAIDERERRVAKGYAMIAFPCAPSVSAAASSVFARDFCGFGGVSVYHGAFGDFYGDLFGDGIFCGKGLADVRVYDALLRGRFPAERVLSHDIVEGSVLRVKTLTDTVLTDSFPRTESAYLRRAHRWIRGDVQNLIFVFGKNGLKKNGKTDRLAFYRLTDNVRRALLPVSELAGLLLSLLLPSAAGTATAAVCLLAAAFGELRRAFAEVVGGGLRALTGSFVGGAAPRALSSLRRAFLSVCRIGVEGSNAFDAIVRALYRMSISKRKLLEWTTASAADASGGTARVFAERIPSLISAALLVLSRRPLLVAVGAAFVFDLFYALYSRRPLGINKPALRGSRREYIKAQTEKIWGFFADSHKEAFHFLPPDNVCLSPMRRVARRTSPTNIGLCLCAFLAARDLGFIDSSRLCDMLGETLNAVEMLEKSKGNLLNWYDISTLEPLSPAFVSFVDSGNFLCCLISLREGLREYFGEEPRLFDLSARIEKLISDCDLSVFYDSVRRLFRTGYDARTGEGSDSFYDLRVSEARMSGFAAVAMGRAPVRHMGAPARIGGKYRGTEGLLSWSGTMFEYFMPPLFLPVGDHTLDDQSLWFAYRAQRGFGRRNGVPWGVSESCFFAFDENMEYRYKAHGVPECALCPPGEPEVVIAPYASFLALPYAGSPAAENLKRLEKLGAAGKYGFYEAVDFTPDRADSDRAAVVRSYMSHHLGMSLLAAENALNGNIWQRRFCSRAEIFAAAGLLEEGIAPGARAPKRKLRRERLERERPGYRGGFPAALYPGGELSAAVHRSGCAALSFGGRSVFFQGRDLVREPFGVFAAVFGEAGTIPFTPAPLFGDGESQFEANKTDAVWNAASGGVYLRQRFYVSREGGAAFYEYRIRNKTGRRQPLSFAAYAEPSLASVREEHSHRAYSKLFIKNRIDRERRVMVFSRTTENDSAALVMGLDAPCVYTAEKRSAYGARIFDRVPAPDGIAGSVDCCFCARTEIDLGARAETTLRLTICVGNNESEALECYDSFVEKPVPAQAAWVREPSKAAALSAALCKMIFPDAVPVSDGFSPRQSELWSEGISGDRPIIAADAARLSRRELADAAAVSRALNLCGFENELAVICREKDRYASPVRKNAEQILRGAPNSRIVDEDGLPTAAEAVRALASFSFPPSDDKLRSKPEELKRCVADLSHGGLSCPTEDGFLIVRGAEEKPWSGCLANKSFGTLFTNRSLGFTWALNSAENKMTPWFGAPGQPQRGELLTLRGENGCFDLVDGAAAFFCETSARWLCRVGELKICAELTVPEIGMKKDLRVDIENTGADAFSGELAYSVFPVLGRDTGDGRAARKKIYRGGVLFYNNYTGQNEGYMYLYSHGGECVPAPCFACCAGLPGGGSVRRTITLNAGEKMQILFSLSFAATENAALFLARTPFLPRMKSTSALNKKNPGGISESALLWQTKRVRLFARCGPYQCSGAYGFRDQLQDCVNLVRHEPELLKIQILRCAAAQFRAGDVLHWFHVGTQNGRQTVKGVRTHCSDDLLWLPYAAAEFVSVTGKREILSVPVPFVEDIPLGERERDKYAVCSRTRERATVLEHCRRALERADRRGAGGLLLMGGGDWNDSFGEVGAKGAGESVWLTQFYALTLKKFAGVCTGEEMKTYLSRAEELLHAVDENAWFGDRYARAFFDDGTPMGVAGCGNSEIDLLPQSFAALSGMPDTERVKTALRTAFDTLYDRKNRIVKLFAPPFDETKKRAGYVNFYPRGVRENGGQYTHAAVWFALALRRVGMDAEADEIMAALDPMNRLQPDGTTGKYENEPYAMTADVYSLENHEGAGGWSLYTGAAGWYLTAKF